LGENRVQLQRTQLLLASAVGRFPINLAGKGDDPKQSVLWLLLRAFSSLVGESTVDESTAAVKD
jgi:hypothetical protein